MDEPIQRELDLDDETDSNSSTTHQATSAASASFSLVLMRSILLRLIQVLGVLIRLAPWRSRRDRTATQPASLTQPTSPPSSPSRKSHLKPVNEKILDLLHKPVNITANPKRQNGFVYVLPFNHNGKTIVKIGHTEETADIRAADIIRKCRGTIQLQDRRVAGRQHELASLYLRVERLAHAELAGRLYNFECNCKTQHTEFFDVDEEFAYEVVGRWVRFCKEQEPWPLPGATRTSKSIELTPEWQARLAEYREALLGGHPRASVGGGSDNGGDEDDLKIRAAQWQFVLDVTDWAWFRRDLWDWSAALWRHRVAALVVLLCAVIVCLGWNSNGILVRKVCWYAFQLGYGVVVYWARDFRCVTAKRLMKRLSEWGRELPPWVSASFDSFSGGILLVWSLVSRVSSHTR